MNERDDQTGRIAARPGEPTASGGTAGLQQIGLGAERDGLLYAPADARDALPLVVSLHGAGGRADGAAARLMKKADELGFLVLAPESRGPTWDVMGGSFGSDVSFIDRSLEWVFARYRVDPRLIAIEGFSDGASYALSLGITNGDLFSTILALSPGFAAAAGARGAPKIWISHGTKDEVLPIETTSHRLAPALTRSGFRVRFTEFDGGHEAPRWLTTAAIDWWLEDRDG